MLSSSPLVSVIIPTFNRSALVCEALDSVLAQTYRNFEILVVDDGSTDDTKSAIEKKYRDNSRIKYFFKAQGGPGSARNHGVLHSRGELIAFLDSDDLWIPEKLERQVDQMERNPEAVMSFTDALVQAIPANGRTRFQAKRFRGDTTLRAMVETNFPLCTPAVIVRRRVLQEVGGFDESLMCAQDWDLWIRILARHRVVYLDQPAVIIRSRDDGVSRSRTLEKWQCWLRVWQKHQSLLLQSGCKPRSVRSRLAHAHKKIAQSCLSLKRYSEARSHFGEWWRRQPWQVRGLLWWSALSLAPAGRKVDPERRSSP